MSSTDRRPWLRVVPGAVSVILLLWLCRSMELSALRAGLRQLSVQALLLLGCAAMAATVVQGIRFWLLFPGGLTLWRHLGLNFAVQAGNILLPVRTGEFLRPFYMKGWNPQISLRALIGWTVVDKLVELLAALPLILGACALLPAQLESLQRWAWLLGISTTVLLSVVCVITARRTSLRNEPGRSFGRLLVAFPLALLYWLMNYLIFWSVVPNARLALLLLLGVSFAAGVPALPAGMGSYEAAFVWIGQLGHLPKEQLLAAALVSHIAQIALSLLAGIAVFLRWGWPRASDVVAATSLGATADGETD